MDDATHAVLCLQINSSPIREKALYEITMVMVFGVHLLALEAKAIITREIYHLDVRFFERRK